MISRPHRRFIEIADRPKPIKSPHSLAIRRGGFLLGDGFVDFGLRINPPPPPIASIIMDSLKLPIAPNQ
jgi:hypothetical protein